MGTMHQGNVPVDIEKAFPASAADCSKNISPDWLGAPRFATWDIRELRKQNRIPAAIYSVADAQSNAMAATIEPGGRRHAFAATEIIPQHFANYL